MMWGHYAKNENGVCIEIDSDMLNLDGIECKEVYYTPKIATLTIFQDDINKHFNLERYINYYKDRIFFTKHESWKYENEYRMITRIGENTKEIFLPIQNAVNKVFIYQDSGINADIVDKIINKEVEIHCLTISQVGGYSHVSAYKPLKYNKPNDLKI